MPCNIKIIGKFCIKNISFQTSSKNLELFPVYQAQIKLVASQNSVASIRVRTYITLACNANRYIFCLHYLHSDKYPHLYCYYQKFLAVTPSDLFLACRSVQRSGNLKHFIQYTGVDFSRFAVSFYEYLVLFLSSTVQLSLGPVFTESEPILRLQGIKLTNIM